MMLNLRVFRILVYLLSCYQLIGGNTTDPGCDKPEGFCLCYFELENSLLATESNRIDLTTTFFPPEANPPEFVTVRYHFKNSSATQLWFWSTQTSHFIHPFQMFQFLSLFFSKPEPYYTDAIDITLENECANLSTTDIKLQLLTQRLKLYAERNNLPSSTIVLRDTYSAKAYSKDSLKILLQEDSEQIKNIIICTAFFVVFIVLLILGVMLFNFFCSNSHKGSDWVKKIDKKKPTILTLTVLSAIVNLYIIALTSAAIHYWRQVHKNGDLLYDFDVGRNLGPLVIATIFDCLCMIAWIIIVIVAGLSYRKAVMLRGSNPNPNPDPHPNSADPPKENYTFVILSLTILCPFFCIIAHSPYIAISYLNDGDHASSIFIYYTVVCYIFFGVTWLFFHWCQNKEKVENNTSTTDSNPNAFHSICTQNNKFKNFRTVSMLLLIGTIFLLLGLAVLIACYFIIIPINKAISDAPMRVLSIYQSGGFIIGSFIVYKVLDYFYSKSKDKDKDKDKDKNGD